MLDDKLAINPNMVKGELWKFSTHTWISRQEERDAFISSFIENLMTRGIREHMVREKIQYTGKR